MPRLRKLKGKKDRHTAGAIVLVISLIAFFYILYSRRKILNEWEAKTMLSLNLCLMTVGAFLWQT